MADTAKRLVGPAFLSATSTGLYTVPASTTTVVRSIHCLNAHASSVVTFNLGIGAANVASSCLFYTYSIPPSGVLDWSGFLVLAAGEVLHALGSMANNLTLVVSGIEVA